MKFILGGVMFLCLVGWCVLCTVGCSSDMASGYPGTSRMTNYQVRHVPDYSQYTSHRAAKSVSSVETE